MDLPEIGLPTNTNSAGQRLGTDKADYEKFVVVDTNGALGEAGSVAYAFDLVKNKNLQARATFLEKLFGAVGMQVKVREARELADVKEVDPIELMKQYATGK